VDGVAAGPLQRRLCQQSSTGRCGSSSSGCPPRRACGVRLSELAGIRYDPQDPLRSDIDVWQREITVVGKGGRPRIVRIGYDAARAVDRYVRARRTYDRIMTDSNLV
jgi:hypothetical protein